jgi:transcriptional regulator with XRE-family HTH domain
MPMTILVKNKLRRARLDKPMTQEELSQKSGVTEATISRLESGSAARISTVKKLATALGVQPAELIDTITYFPQHLRPPG